MFKAFIWYSLAIFIVFYLFIALCIAFYGIFIGSSIIIIALYSTEKKHVFQAKNAVLKIFGCLF